MGIGCEFVPFLDYLGQYVAVLDMHGSIGVNASYKPTCASSLTLACFAGRPTLSPLALA